MRPVEARDVVELTRLGMHPAEARHYADGLYNRVRADPWDHAGVLGLIEACSKLEVAKVGPFMRERSVTLGRKGTTDCQPGLSRWACERADVAERLAK